MKVLLIKNRITEARRLSMSVGLLDEKDLRSIASRELDRYPPTVLAWIKSHLW